MKTNGFGSWWMLLLALPLTAGCGGKRGAAGGGAAPAPLTAEVVEGPLVLSVQGYGEINAKKSKKLIPHMRRGSTITFLVPDGSRVTTNDIVVRFNPDDVDRQISDLESSLSDNQSKVDSARVDLEIQLMDNTSTVKKAEQDYQSAKMDLEKYLQGDDPLDRRNAELKLQTARSDLDRKTKKFDELQGLLKEGFVTEDEVEEARIDVDTARVAVETAEIEQRLLLKYTAPQKKAGFEIALAKAATELDKARKQTEALRQSKAQALASAQHALDRVQSDLDSARKDRKEFDLYAPADGVVMYGNPDEPWRRGDIQVGGNFSPGQVLMTIPEMSCMQASVNVPEDDVHAVHVGQRATVRVDALAGREFSALVTNVAEVANAGGWWSSDVKEFKVDLALSDSKDLKPGFSCKTEIVTESISSAIYAPVQAVFRDKDRYIVYALNSPVAKPVEVKIGRIATKYAEILSGVTSGTKLLLNPPSAETPKP